MIRRVLSPISWLALTCSILGGLAIAGASPDVKPFVDLFESRYRAARTLQATFLERYTENGHLVRVESGTAYFRRPGKMRWEYQAPEKNVFLVDGKNAWFYVPADHTATRVPAKSSADWRTPLALLAGEMKVSRVCAQVQAAPREKVEAPGNVMLRCELRGAAAPSEATHNSDSTVPAHESVQSVYLEIVKKTGELVGVTVRDPGGVGIEFRFDNWQANPPVADSLFHFLAPPGVAIVNGELPAGDTGVNP
ncbi:MAG TPA: outer membrane lipoprotein carrier protein LolA [Candidatus Acidoferrum sp.]|nr:outer membrane lipoprotein carrier protein LolA [Candidatus Acidoferrum sp.]